MFLRGTVAGARKEKATQMINQMSTVSDASRQEGSIRVKQPTSCREAAHLTVEVCLDGGLAKSTPIVLSLPPALSWFGLLQREFVLFPITCDKSAPRAFHFAFGSFVVEGT